MENFNEKVFELMNDKTMITPFLAPSLVDLFKPENRSQFRILKVHNSTEMKDFLINTIVPVTLYSKMLTFRDTSKSFKKDGDLLKMITIYKFIVDHSTPHDKKIIYEFGKETNFDNKQKERQRNRDKSRIKTT